MWVDIFGFSERRGGKSEQFRAQTMAESLGRRRISPAPYPYIPLDAFIVRWEADMQRHICIWAEPRDFDPVYS